MSLEEYNDILSKMLNTRRTLAKMKSELEGREGRKCWECKRFGHLAKNCRNKGERVEEKKRLTNRFKTLTSRVMQCGVKEVRRQETVREVVKCFGCEREGHKKWECPQKNERSRRKEAAPQQAVWEKVKRHSGAKGLPPRGAAVCMEGWTTPREVVTFVECRGCDYKGTKTEENQGQGFLSKEQLCNMWCGSCKEAWNWREEEAKGGRAERVKCSACGGKDAVVGGEVERNEKGEVFCPLCRTGRKMPWWNWGRELKQSVPRAQEKGAGITDPEKQQREVRRTLKGLREVWMQIGVEKIDTHKGVSVKALLDSGATGLFMNKKCAERGGFKLIKLGRPIIVRNVDGTGNSGGSITHEVEVNLYFKGHVERVRMDVCDLGKTEVILGMPWLQAHNPEIDWEKGEVKMTRCPPICERYTGKKEMGPEIKKRRQGKKEIQEDEIERIRWAADEKEERRKWNWITKRWKQWCHKNSTSG